MSDQIDPIQFGELRAACLAVKAKYQKGQK
jgi:hypothetical protein